MMRSNYPRDFESVGAPVYKNIFIVNCSRDSGELVKSVFNIEDMKLETVLFRAHDRFALEDFYPEHGRFTAYMCLVDANVRYLPGRSTRVADYLFCNLQVRRKTLHETDLRRYVQLAGLSWDCL